MRKIEFLSNPRSRGVGVECVDIAWKVDDARDFAFPWNYHSDVLP